MRQTLTSVVTSFPGIWQTNVNKKFFQNWNSTPDGSFSKDAESATPYYGMLNVCALFLISLGTLDLVYRI